MGHESKRKPLSPSPKFMILITLHLANCKIFSVENFQSTNKIDIFESHCYNWSKNFPTVIVRHLNDTRKIILFNWLLVFSSAEFFATLPNKLEKSSIATLPNKLEK